MKEKNMPLELVNLAFKAGSLIMDIYQKDFDVNLKEDNSPVTIADQKAEKLILSALDDIFPNIPVISEEAYSIGFVPKFDKKFFLVDPLDGTKEFIKKNGEFTVNIGLIEDNIAKLGVVYAPEKGFMYFCDENNNAFELKIKPNFSGSISEAKRIRVNSSRISDLTAITSRSHNNQETTDFLKDYKIKETLFAGSSYKFCLIASGKADIYPRLTPTCEWDTAAGHAVLKAAGGNICSLEGNELTYGFKEKKFINPSFLARN